MATLSVFFLLFATIVIYRYLPLDRSLSVSLPDPMEELPPFLEGAAIAEKPDFIGSTKRIKKVDPEKKKEQNR